MTHIPEKYMKLAPARMTTAIHSVEKLGYKIDYQDDSKIEFQHRGSRVTYFPYSGWATGKTIHDGRGLLRLLSQLDNLKAK